MKNPFWNKIKAVEIKYKNPTVYFLNKDQLIVFGVCCGLIGIAFAYCIKNYF